MSVNVYDVAYNLEKAVRESDDYKSLKSLYEALNADPQAKQLFDRFRTLQMELQQKQMMGQEISEEEVQQAQQTVAIVQQNEKIAKLMEAEQRMSMLIGELNKIIMKPLEEIYGNPEDQQ
ncbi:YlbF family regulator [Bacillus sp. CGMCC 1.16541]|uniref:YlbF family regulator n=1 Tax=Bacillus sp. CGMCC 1.16541 TaxID=2185143 RepID=UPI000D72EBD3|nr:YlbF family regulator [Bacillus sp. CGMCC 1.16541]